MARRSAETFFTSRSGQGPDRDRDREPRSLIEGQAFSLDASSHFVTPAVGNSLTFSGSIAATTALIPSTAGSSPACRPMVISATIGWRLTATNTMARPSAETFHLQVTDERPSTTAITGPDSSKARRIHDMSGHFVAPAASDTLTFAAGSIPARLGVDAHTSIISSVPTNQLGNHPNHGDSDRRPWQGRRRNLAPSGRRQWPDRNRHCQPDGIRGPGLLARRRQPLHGSGCRRRADLLRVLAASLGVNSHTSIISGMPSDADFRRRQPISNFTFSSFDGNFTVTGGLATSRSLDAAGGFDITDGLSRSV